MNSEYDFSDQTMKRLSIGFYIDHFFLEIADDQELTCDTKKKQAAEVHSLLVPFDGEWGPQTDKSFYNNHLPKIFYFVGMDCEHQFHFSDKNMPMVEIELEITNWLEGQT